MVNYLLQSIASYGKFLLWYLVRFFNKAVKNYDFSPDQGAEKCSADSFVSFGTDFEKAVPQRPCCVAFPDWGHALPYGWSTRETAHAN
jgi:hypothetical protein